MYISECTYGDGSAWNKDKWNRRTCSQAYAVGRTGSLTWYINGAIVGLKRNVNIGGWFADDCMNCHIGNCRTEKHQGECAAIQFL